MKKLMLTIMISLGAYVPAFAADIWNGLGSVGAFYVQRQGFSFTYSGTRNDVTTCSGNTYYSIPKAHENYSALVSLVLAAKISAKNISVNTDGTCGFYGHNVDRIEMQ